MATKDKKGFWVDGKGNSVPVGYVKKIDKQRDKVVEKIFKEAVVLEAKLRDFKIRTSAAIDEFLAYSANAGSVKRKDWKGNVMLSNFTVDKRVERNIQEYIDFDERLMQAKAIIDELLIKWSAGANKNLIAIIDRAFEMDKKGNMNVKSILGLRKLKIDNKDWRKAMELIDEARSIHGSKAYIRIQQREGKEGIWKSINLDLASIVLGDE